MITDRIGLIPIQRLAKAHEIARLVEFLVNDESEYITGSVFNISGGIL